MAKTHCIHGHPYTPENTWLKRLHGKTVGRRCKTCVRECNRTYEQYKRKRKHRIEVL